LRLRAERKERRVREREETRRNMQEHTWHEAGADGGLPYWTPRE
jgi:hypothetical protein